GRTEPEPVGDRLRDDDPVRRLPARRRDPERYAHPLLDARREQDVARHPPEVCAAAGHAPALLEQGLEGHGLARRVEDAAETGASRVEDPGGEVADVDELDRVARVA